MRLGGVLLVGGLGTRIGGPKASLQFRGITLAARALNALSPVAAPIVAVHAKGQRVPELAGRCECAFDERDAAGPLEGLRVGLRALQDRADAAAVLAVDAPFVTSRFISALAARLIVSDAVVPRTRDGIHPLIAVYRVGLHAVAEELLAAGQRALTALLDRIRVTWFEGADLAAADPTATALFNVNSLDDLRRAEGLARDP